MVFDMILNTEEIPCKIVWKLSAVPPLAFIVSINNFKVLTALCTGLIFDKVLNKLFAKSINVSNAFVGSK